MDDPLFTDDENRRLGWPPHPFVGVPLPWWVWLLPASMLLGVFVVALAIGGLR